MLILSRFADQTIKIGDDITITVIDVRGKKARIAIDAPKNITVHRGEIYDLIQRGEGKRDAQQ
jgi:carbon storage regulator